MMNTAMMMWTLWSSSPNINGSRHRCLVWPMSVSYTHLTSDHVCYGDTTDLLFYIRVKQKMHESASF